jgi:hypothetical protein
MLFPVARRELGDAAGGMFADPLQNINQAAESALSDRQNPALTGLHGRQRATP